MLFVMWHLRFGMVAGGAHALRHPGFDCSCTCRLQLHCLLHIGIVICLPSKCQCHCRFMFMTVLTVCSWTLGGCRPPPLPADRHLSRWSSTAPPIRSHLCCLGTPTKRESDTSECSLGARPCARIPGSPLSLPNPVCCSHIRSAALSGSPA